MRVSESSYSRDIRSFELAVWMLSREARTHTISAWTGLSAERIRKLCLGQQREGLQKGARRQRGPSPTQLNSVLTSASLRTEAAVVAYVCRTLKVIPGEPLAHADRALPSIFRGERLCSALELFQRLVPHPRLTLEQWMLLLRSLADGTEWGIARCTNCPAMVVEDRLAVAQPLCEDCQHEKRSKKASATKAGRSRKAPVTSEARNEPEPGEPEQLKLFDTKKPEGSR